MARPSQNEGADNRLHDATRRTRLSQNVHKIRGLCLFGKVRVRHRSRARAQSPFWVRIQAALPPARVLAELPTGTEVL